MIGPATRRQPTSRRVWSGPCRKPAAGAGFGRRYRPEPPPANALRGTCRFRLPLVTSVQPSRLRRYPGSCPSNGNLGERKPAGGATPPLHLGDPRDPEPAPDRGEPHAVPGISGRRPSAPGGSALRAVSRSASFDAPGGNSLRAGARDQDEPPVGSALSFPRGLGLPTPQDRRLTSMPAARGGL